MIKVRVKHTDVESAYHHHTTTSVAALARTIGVEPREISFEGNFARIYQDGESVRKYKISNECLEIMNQIDSDALARYEEGETDFGFFSLKKK